MQNSQQESPSANGCMIGQVWSPGIDEGLSTVETTFRRLGASLLLYVSPSDGRQPVLPQLSRKDRRLLISFLSGEQADGPGLASNVSDSLRLRSSISGNGRQEQPRQRSGSTAAARRVELESFLLHPAVDVTGRQRLGLPPPAYSRERTPASSPRRRVSMETAVHAQVCFDTPRLQSEVSLDNPSIGL